MKYVSELNNITKSEFNKLNVFQKRVLIAKDVLQRLENENFKENSIEKSSYYFSFSKTSRLSKKLAYKVINEECCYVCAKGSVMCSYFGKFKGISLYDLSPYRSEILDIFGECLLTGMEDLFEGYMSGFDLMHNYPIKKWNLKQIMRNIIKNNGKLKIVLKKNKKNKQKTIYIS